MLDVECFTYLNRALESPISPIVVLASNRGMAAIRGADDLVAAHGVPPDFLTRLLIIPTHPYDGEEIKRIVRIRATTEGVQITDAAIDKIAEHGVRISLRYCLQLLTPARYVSFCLGCPPSVCGERVRRERGRQCMLTSPPPQQHPRAGQWPQPDRRPGCRRVRGPLPGRPSERNHAGERVWPGLHLIIPFGSRRYQSNTRLAPWD